MIVLRCFYGLWGLLKTTKKGKVIFMMKFVMITSLSSQSSSLCSQSWCFAMPIFTSSKDAFSNF